jgi:tetratricopeptide (TPR) repeat protein
LLGKTYAELGQFEPAERSLKRALEVDPNSFNTYVQLGNLYFREKAIDKAIAEYQEAARLNPKSVGAWTVLGMLHDSLSQFKLAEKDYEAALAIDPNAGVAANNLAWLYCEHGGDMDKALELARRAKQVLPNAARVSGTLAWIYYKRQLYNSAVPLLEEAVREEPKDAQIRFELAASLLKAGKKAQAREELDVALKLDPGLRNDQDYKHIFGQ